MLRLPLAAVLLAAACQPSAAKAHAPPEWDRLVHPIVAPARRSVAPDSLLVISDSTLKPYLPARLLGREGSAPQGSMTRIGGRSLSEVTRSYRGSPGADGRAELKLADARFEPRATEAIRTLAGDETQADGDADLAEPLVLPGAVGYARYDESERIAQAQVVIGGRFIASATVLQARDSKEAVAALRSLDTLGLSRLAQSN